ncbi:MAG: DMT family transporter [Puniceicoccales bacterium]|jgi:S-adenosylmethionine uptake transporter|nr:DMT family transporter [Puniceicoccales bacterium]
MGRLGQNYFKGIGWFIASLMVCETNDVITKFLERSLSPLQVILGRFFFSTLALLPFMFADRVNFRSKYLGANFLRGVILFIGMFIWCYGLDASQLSIACLINFTTPMFTLILAALILKEKIEKPCIIATIIGFLGVAIVLNPRTASFSTITASLFLLSAFFFALLDILNKKLITKETMLGSLFFTSFFTMLCTFGVMLLSKNAVHSLMAILTTGWQNITLFVFLGIGANFLLFFILKSLSYIDVSAAAPFRYVELVLASTFGYLFFDEKISTNAILGAIIIIPSVIYLVRCESQANNSKFKNNTQTRNVPTHCC